MKSLEFILVLLFGTYSISSCNIQEADGGKTSTLPGNLKVVSLKTCNTKRVDDSTIRILFVGNSLTCSNSLPKLVEHIGSAHGKTMDTKTLAYPNYALEDHWNDETMSHFICEVNFDFVVVQQGPSSQVEGRQMLLEYGQLIKGLCLSRGTQLAFFMVWPSITNKHTFDGVIDNYSYAGSQTESILCTVGTEFKKHVEKGDYHFYSTDQFHPSLEGSQAAATIIYSALIK